MARTPRSFTVQPGHSVHKVWRGHNRERNLGTDRQKQTYLDYLNADLENDKYRQGSTLQALTLMDNHTHEMNHIFIAKLFSDHMRRHHSRYGSYFNRENGRSGKVAEDRPHTTLIESWHQEMETVFYIHANPIRANMQDAQRYYWSTHRLYAFGKREPRMRNVVLPKWYLDLGRNPEARQQAYRRLFARYLEIHGQFKQNFLKKNFIGSVTWCDQQLKLVRAWRKSHAPP